MVNFRLLISEYLINEIVCVSISVLVLVVQLHRIHFVHDLGHVVWRVSGRGRFGLWSLVFIQVQLVFQELQHLLLPLAVQRVNDTGDGVAP